MSVEFTDTRTDPIYKHHERVVTTVLCPCWKETQKGFLFLAQRCAQRWALKLVPRIFPCKSQHKHKGAQTSPAPLCSQPHCSVRNISTETRPSSVPPLEGCSGPCSTQLHHSCCTLISCLLRQVSEIQDHVACYSAELPAVGTGPEVLQLIQFLTVSVFPCQCTM